MTQPNLYERQFSEAHDFPPPEKETRTLVLAFTARCGSHMLGHTLHETGRFGFPLEYLNGGNLAEWKRRLGTSGPTDTIAALRTRRTSPNGIFSIKLHYAHCRMLGGTDAMNALFPNARYLLLRRSDVLAQAVSYAKAKQTGVWINGQEPTGEPAYDEALIDRCLHRVLRETEAWRYLLSTERLPFRELCFEQILEDVPGTIRSIASFLDVPLPDADVPDQPPTTRQRSRINQEWMDRFRRSRNNDLLPVEDPTQPSSPGFLTHLKHRVRRLLSG